MKKRIKNKSMHKKTLAIFFGLVLIIFSVNYLITHYECEIKSVSLMRVRCEKVSLAGHSCPTYYELRDGTIPGGIFVNKSDKLCNHDEIKSSYDGPPTYQLDRAGNYQYQD